jgi:hypothetical protein
MVPETRTPSASDTTLDSLTSRLDDLETSLPTVPAKVIRVTRATARRLNDVVESTVSAIADQVSAITSSTTTSASTTLGQARAQANAVSKSAVRGAKTTVGQARAEVAQTARVVTDKVESALDNATLSIDPDDLADMTKADLYDRAQDMEIEGRSTMTKAELVAALQRA